MKVTVKVAQTAPFYDNEREDEQTVSVSEENGRYSYRPHHVGDTVMTTDGYAEIVEVTDHPCSALSGCGGACGGDHLSDECCIDEITLENYTEETK